MLLNSRRALLSTLLQLKDMDKEVLRYKRADGVDLTGTLYLPPGYDAAKDGPLPTILWAYPREYKSRVRQCGNHIYNNQ